MILQECQCILLILKIRMFHHILTHILVVGIVYIGGCRWFMRRYSYEWLMFHFPKQKVFQFLEFLQGVHFHSLKLHYWRILIISSLCEFSPVGNGWDMHRMPLLWKCDCNEHCFFETIQFMILATRPFSTEMITQSVLRFFVGSISSSFSAPSLFLFRVLSLPFCK